MLCSFSKYLSTNTSHLRTMSGRSFWARSANLSSVLNWWPRKTWAHVICSLGTVELWTPSTAAVAALDLFVVYDACWNKCQPSLRLNLLPLVEAFDIVSTIPVEFRFGRAVRDSIRPSLDFRATAFVISEITRVNSSVSWSARFPLLCFGLPVSARNSSHYCKHNSAVCHAAYWLRL